MVNNENEPDCTQYLRTQQPTPNAHLRNKPTRGRPPENVCHLLRANNLETRRCCCRRYNHSRGQCSPATAYLCKPSQHRLFSQRRLSLGGVLHYLGEVPRLAVGRREAHQTAVGAQKDVEQRQHARVLEPLEQADLDARPRKRKEKAHHSGGCASHPYARFTRTSAWERETSVVKPLKRNS